MSNENAFLEHANMTVSDLDEAVRFITTAFPHFRVRGRGESNGRPWLHVGTDTTYVAFSESSDAPPERTPYDQLGFNHLGFVVEDTQSIFEALSAAGYREGIQAVPHPHRRRLYFYDRDGNEWEFVEYQSDVAAERNDYSE